MALAMWVVSILLLEDTEEDTEMLARYLQTLPWVDDAILVKRVLNATDHLAALRFRKSNKNLHRSFQSLLSCQRHSYSMAANAYDRDEEE